VREKCLSGRIERSANRRQRLGCLEDGMQGLSLRQRYDLRGRWLRLWLGLGIGIWVLATTAFAEVAKVVFGSLARLRGAVVVDERQERRYLCVPGKRLTAVT
jgi:hypothetical protein